jgi:hypothetical protein
MAPSPNPDDAMPVITLAAAQPPAPPPVKLASAGAPDPMVNVEALLRTLPAQAPHHPARPRHHAATHELARNRPADDGGSALAPIAMAAPPPLLGAQVMSVRAVAPAPPPLPAYGGSMLGMAQPMGQGGSSN